MMRNRVASTTPGANPRTLSIGVTAPARPTATAREATQRALAAEGAAVGNCETELAGVPHEAQNRADSGTSAAQPEQRNIGADCTASTLRFGETISFWHIVYGDQPKHLYRQDIRSCQNRLRTIPAQTVNTPGFRSP